MSGSVRDPALKLVPWTEVEKLASRLRARGTLLVSTNGCFDLLHLGHLGALRDARLLGNCLWVGINSDRSVRRLKGTSRPIQTENTRAMQLAALEAVDYVTVFDHDTPEEWLAKIKPLVHVKGGDYDPSQLPEKKIVEQAGGKVVCVPLTPGYSTTDLISRIKTSSR